MKVRVVCKIISCPVKVKVKVMDSKKVQEKCAMCKSKSGLQNYFCPVTENDSKK